MPIETRVDLDPHLVEEIIALARSAKQCRKELERETAACGNSSTRSGSGCAARDCTK
jgi:hypothetical protein